jgi:hypothetical protein
MYCNTGKNIDQKGKCIEVENTMEYYIERRKNMRSKEHATYIWRERNIFSTISHLFYHPVYFKTRCVGLTTMPPSMSRMSENVGTLTSRNPKGLHVLYRETFTYTLKI